MKPRLGRTVYCIYGDTILVETVAFLGEESFIIESFGEDTYANSWEWRYDAYEKRWFTNLAKAKKELLSRFKEYGNTVKIVKHGDHYGGWYQLEFKDDE